MSITTLFDALDGYLRHRRACRELALLDERSLRDIGLDRGAIFSAAADRHASRAL